MVTVTAAPSNGGPVLVTKGAPEAVLARCSDVPTEATAVLERLFGEGARVVAVAAREASGAAAQPSAEDERDLELVGFLTFRDPAKADARTSIAKLAALGIEMKVITGDNGTVAARICDDIGLTLRGVLSGADVAALSDAALSEAIPGTTVFARVSPEQKSRIIKVARRLGDDVAFLGDGVNDAVALHAADVGISVDSATDVAKDAADIVLLEKDLGVLADGVKEGRRIFANTMKYVLMATSSNFGNMFSAAGASLFLSFLPMLPSQILLNNLLYDAGQLAIPTDRVDPETVARPAAWDIGFVRRFMTVFGPISSIFDFLTFYVMLTILQRRAHRVPHRLVRRIARHTDARRVPHPHTSHPLLPQPPQHRDDHHPNSHGHPRRHPPLHTSRRRPRVRRSPDHLLPHPRCDGDRIPHARGDHQEPLLRPRARPAHPPEDDPRGAARPPHPPTHRPLHPSRDRTLPITSGRRGRLQKPLRRAANQSPWSTAPSARRVRATLPPAY